MTCIYFEKGLWHWFLTGTDATNLFYFFILHVFHKLTPNIYYVIDFILRLTSQVFSKFILNFTPGSVVFLETNDIILTRSRVETYAWVVLLNCVLSTYFHTCFCSSFLTHSLSVAKNLESWQLILLWTWQFDNKKRIYFIQLNLNSNNQKNSY